MRKFWEGILLLVIERYRIISRKKLKIEKFDKTKKARQCD